MYPLKTVDQKTFSTCLTKDHLQLRAEEWVMKIGWGGVHEYERARVCKHHLQAWPASTCQILEEHKACLSHSSLLNLVSLFMIYH